MSLTLASSVKFPSAWHKQSWAPPWKHVLCKLQVLIAGCQSMAMVSQVLGLDCKEISWWCVLGVCPLPHWCTPAPLDNCRMNRSVSITTHDHHRLWLQRQNTSNFLNWWQFACRCWLMWLLLLLPHHASRLSQTKTVLLNKILMLQMTIC